MTTPTSCPGVDDLKQFRLGLVSQGQVRRLEQHLAECPACMGRLPALAPDDALVRGLREQRGRPRLNNPVLARVQEELRAQPPRPPAGDHPTPSGQMTDATLGEPPFPDATVAGSPEAVNALDPVHASLSPPRGPGEIGWLGPFRVLGVLGQGGMGVVLQAEDSRLQRRVALKVMKPELASDPLAHQRFLREARATAALEHEHIIAIHHIDEANGVPYLAMPLLQGEPLEDRLRREHVLSVREVLRIGRETALGLAAAHEKGLIHRDIKPGNLWLEAPGGRVKILDFGLAAMPCAEGEKTLPGTILGTPGYMAPEQTEGEADHRADLFSLGCLLYRMATGRMPFKGQTLVQKIRSTLFDTPEPPQQLNPALPLPLCQLIQRLMERKPEDRPASALAVVRVLETLQSQLAQGAAAPIAILVPRSAGSDATLAAAPAAIPVATPGPAPRRPAWQWPPDRRWVMLAGGGAAALLILVVVLAVVSRKPSPPREEARAEEGTSTSEDTRRRRPVPPRKRPAAEVAPPAEVTPDRRFPETWVLNPAPIEGLKGWSIETNDVGQTYPVAFNFTSDERFLIRFGTAPNNPTFAWSEYDYKTCGLVAAPFEGRYNMLRADTRVCARIVTGGIQLWEQGAPKPYVTLRSPGPTYAAAFSPDGKKIVTLSIHYAPHSRELWFWDVAEGSKIAVCSLSDFTVLAYTCSWSPDGTTLAVASQNGVALFRAPWNKCAGTIIRPGGVTALAWSPDGKYLATVESDREVRVIDVERGETVADLGDLQACRPDFVPAWSPDGKELAVATEDRKVVVWDLAEKKASFAFAGHTRPINVVAFLNDNKTLVSASAGAVRFWDLEGYRLRGTLLNLGGSEWLAIGPDGNYRCSKGAETRFVFKVREENNRLREYSPDDFRKVYGWKNHPEKVRLTGE